MHKICQDINIGGNLRKQRKKAGLTQEQTAVQLQLLGSATTRAIYSRYETGELNIKVSDLIQLRRIFDCSYEDIFEAKE
jgi:Helix-turn-helix.